MAKPAAMRSAILFIADIANYDELSATDPASAQRNAARSRKLVTRFLTPQRFTSILQRVR